MTFAVRATGPRSSPLQVHGFVPPGPPLRRRAYGAALAGRDPKLVDPVELLPAIFDAVPDTDEEEIVAALRWRAERLQGKANTLRRYRNAKFGNAGKHATPGDWTIPFRAGVTSGTGAVGPYIASLGSLSAAARLMGSTMLVPFGSIVEN